MSNNDESKSKFHGQAERLLEVFGDHGKIGEIKLASDPSPSGPPAPPPQLDMGVFLILDKSAKTVAAVWSLNKQTDANRTEYWALGTNYVWPHSGGDKIQYTFAPQTVTFTTVTAFKAWVAGQTNTLVEVHQHSITRL